MTWVVDTAVLIDVAENDSRFGRSSAAILEEKLPEGLTLCPITYIEMAPVFDGRAELQNEFLDRAGVDWMQGWTRQDTEAAFAAWARHIERRRSRRGPKRPIADVLIGAFALRFDGLVTRNAKDFSAHFPGLAIVEPGEN